MSRANRFSWAVVLSVLAVVGCGSSSHPRRATGSRAAQPTGLPNGSRVLLRGLQPLSWGTAAGGSLYLTKNLTPPADDHTELINELMRLNPMSGRVLAVRSLDSAFSQALLAEGSLWVTTASRQGTLLWRLDPRSLSVRSRVVLPCSGHTEGLAGSLAVAGGQLWVGTGTLDRVSLASGRVRRVVSCATAGRSRSRLTRPGVS